MTLLEKLAERSKTAQVKTAEQIFSDAFVDELEKLGYDAEFLKESGILDSAWKGLKSLGGAIAGPAKSEGAITHTLKKSKLNSAFMPRPVGASPVVNATPAKSDPYANLLGRDKILAQRADRGIKKISMDKQAIWGTIASKILPALGNFAKGALFFGGKGAAGTAGKVTGAGMMAKDLLPKKQPQIG